MLATPLSPRQEAILDFIASQTPPPSVREIAARFGYRSPASALYQLDELEARGFLRREERKARALQVIRPAPPTGAANGWNRAASNDNLSLTRSEKGGPLGGSAPQRA